MSTLKEVVAKGHQTMVRPVREGDFPQLPKIYSQSLKDNPNGFVQDLSFHGEITVFIKKILDLNGAVLVADIKGKIVGFGALKPERDGSIELCKLHVRRAYQSLGIGKALTQSLVELAAVRGFDLVTLHVTATQFAAIKLYNKLGFRTADRRVFDVKVGREVKAYDTIFMEMPLLVEARMNCTGLSLN